MSRQRNFDLCEKAFLMYSAGMKQADLARDLKISINTITTWKQRDNWDARIAAEGSIANQVKETVKDLTAPSDNSEGTVEETLKKAVTNAITVDRIKPTKWKDVLDTLTFLGRGTPSRQKPSDKAKDVSNSNDDELDLEILRLQGILSNEDEAIIIEEGSVIH